MSAEFKSSPCLSPFWVEKYKSQASVNWDKFYKRNETRFFKDRHWLDAEFPGCLDAACIEGLEVGCGVGNLVFPALERNTSMKLWCCDFSARAIDMVQKHEHYRALYEADRIQAFVSDITLGDLAESDKGKETTHTLKASSLSSHIKSNSLDFVSCIFCLSAIPAQKHLQTLANLSLLLKQGGTLLFRDYTVGDLAQTRFESAKGEVPKLEENLYVRQDGTLSYFFHVDYLVELCLEVGLKVVKCEPILRKVENKKRELDMERVFLQGVFQKQ